MAVAAQFSKAQNDEDSDGKELDELEKALAEYK